MSRGRDRSARVEAMARLFDAGDHGGARRAAAALAGDPSATEAEREAAVELLARIAPHRAVAIAGGVGFAGAVAVALWVLAR